MDGVSPSYSQWQRSCCCGDHSVGKLGPGRVCGVESAGNRAVVDRRSKEAKKGQTRGVALCRNLFTLISLIIIKTNNQSTRQTDQNQDFEQVQARHLHQPRLLRAAPPPPLPPSLSSSPSISRASTAPVTAGDLQGPSTQLQLEGRATMGVNLRSGSASQKRRDTDPPAGSQVHYFTIVNVATAAHVFSLSPGAYPTPQ